MRVRGLFVARLREGRAGALATRRSAATMSGFVGTELLLAAIPLDLALLQTWWPAPDTFGVFAAWISADPCAYAVLLCPLAAALLADRVFAAHTPFEARLRPCVRVARAALAAVPIFGAYALPLWGALAGRAEPARCLCDPSRPRAGLDAAWCGAARLRTAASPWPRGTLALVTSLALSGLVVFVWTLRFTSLGWPAALSGRVFASLLVHAAMALAMAHAGWPRHPWRESGARLALSTAGLMLPLPLTVLGFVAGERYLRDPEATLTRYVFHRSRLAVSSAGFRRAEERTRDAWRRESWWKRSVAPRDIDPLRPLGLADRRRLSLWRLSTWLLVFESAWAAAWCASARPALAPALEWLAVALFFAAGAAALAWSTTLAFRALRLSERVDAAERRPWARYATLAPLACGCGLVFGRAAALGAAALAVTVLMAGALVAIGTWASLFVAYGAGSRRRSDTRDMLWPAAQLAACLVLALLARAWLDGADPLADLPVLALATVALHAWVGARLGGWLTRPLSWRDLATRGPARPRLALVLLGTAAPFGGLLVPIWIAWSRPFCSGQPAYVRSTRSTRRTGRQGKGAPRRAAR